MVGIPPRMDPHDQVLPTDFTTRLCFDSLLVPDGTGGLEGRLAKSYRLIDPCTWEFTLNADAVFASGVAVKAEAVKWNFERLARNRTFAASPRLSTFEDAQVVDARTIRFETRRPDMVWPRRVVQVVIADPAASPDGVGFGACPSPHAGSGLYKTVDFAADGFVRLEQNERSWRGRPSIPSIEMRPYDPPSLEAAFLAGEAHLGYTTEAGVDRLVRGGMILQRQAQANVHMIRFNSLKPPFDDKRLRRAVSLTVDQSAIVREVYRGHGAAANQPVGADCFGYAPDLAALNTDRDEARRLLDQVGFSGEITFDILATSAVIRPWCDRVVADLNSVGLRTTGAYVNMADYLGKMTANNPARGDMIGAGNQYGPGLDADFGVDKFSANVLPAMKEYYNADFQSLYDQSLAETDTGRREVLLQNCARILMEDVACVPIWQPSLGWMVSPEITGLTLNTLGAGWCDWRTVEWR